jgi:hypothetical protein
VTTEVNLKDYGYSAEQMKQFNDAFFERVAPRRASGPSPLRIICRSIQVSWHHYNVEGARTSAKTGGT